MAKLEKVKLTFPDGTSKEYAKGITGLEITKQISQKLLKEALVIKINDRLQDLADPINQDAAIKILKFVDPEGKLAYWHSASHVLADAVKRLWPDTKLGIGPAIDDGFYYDFDKKEPFAEADLKKIEEQMKKIIKDDLKYEHVFLSRKEAEKLLAKEPFKLDILKNDVKENKVSFHKHGKFYDLCNNPVVQSTGQIGVVKLLSIAGAYWRGDSNKGQLQRIYGISFPSQKELDEFLKIQVELEKRDHRKIGKQLKLFHFAEEVGPGLPLWLPNGETVRQVLLKYMRDLEIKYGYKYVSTPHITKSALYLASGHLPYYKDDMYPPMKIDNEEYYLRPMNCPHHHMIYKQLVTSYRDLPLRLAEAGTLYRKEASGAAYGLMRVRGMTQNDSHNYCTRVQTKSEIIRVIDLFKEVYGAMGIKNVWFRLSLPDFKAKTKFGGDIHEWEWAAQQIRSAAKDAKIELREVVGEAAFYGPKIDVQIKNVLGREESIATVQVDIMVAKRMGLGFVNEKNEIENPVIIHRAILGSYERFIAFLIENFAGAFPLWLAPVQVKILSFTDRNQKFAEKVEQQLRDANIRVEPDYSNNTVDYKVRAAELEKVPYILVIGDKEEERGTVAVRKRGTAKVQFGVKTDAFIKQIKEEIDKKL
ncbi:MAG: threonine--tRNA ligase [DPANN group archaeon]|nr:threonine--tRNA ligase [DPANN group archaeon]